ncbi:hypothetical protein GFB49_02430 [Epibacterium sp. SM1979]|uniref:Alpha/beta hydrolase family protein n=1 Tax=Tritonibacter litoralis TaxID=2662264 RepID=A0A843YDA0_9RHOB|nr:hypothetical protein [Tritonibacter litoralis]
MQRRRVFYIPGYDPIHPRRYRELYRKEGAAQAEISGYALTLSPATVQGAFGWRVDAEIADQTVETDFEVMVWSDIVRDSMDASIVGTYLQLIQTAWIYIASGTLNRLMLLRKGPVIAALYPVLMLLIQALLALGLAVLVHKGFVAIWEQITVPGFIADMVGWVAGGFVGARLLHWFKRLDNKLFAYYLMHDYAYSAASRGENSPELEARMAEFAARIRAALDETDVDEVLVVGHSSGAHVGVSVLADLLRQGMPDGGPTLSFLTLGQVVPMVSFLPKAARLRRDLQFLSLQDHVAWVDVTAPGDGCAFALCDPVAVSGVATPQKRWPLVVSAAFTQTLSPKRWAELRWRFFRLHFQYLCAFDRPGDYDYFQITAGPQTLRTRYHARKASPARIDVEVSKYTSMALE